MAVIASELRAAAELVYAHLSPTPQYVWPLLSAELRAEVWVKHENATPTGAFKVRGGLVYVDRLRRERPEVTGIVSATRGNHGQSLAYAGVKAGLRVVIVVPERNSPDKNSAMRAFGAEVVEHGRDFQEAREYAAVVARTEQLEPVPAFHPDLVLGVATYAAELFEAAGELDAVYVPVGMGSGICALIAVRDLLGLPTKIIGVVSNRAPATALSFAARTVVNTDTADTFVDGVACRSPEPAAIDIIVAGAAEVIAVSDDLTAEAMRVMLRCTHQLVEPAGAIALAGAMAHRGAVAAGGSRNTPALTPWPSREVESARQQIAVIATGGNCDAGLLRTVLEGATPDP